jgi:Mg-chelatase subunit ChlD
MLVIDRSTSMEDEEKLDYAQAAARTFTTAMNQTRDRVGLVTFAKAARLDQSLTHDRTAIEAAIDGVVADGGTDIMEGVDLATEELLNRQRADVLPVLILLSDGESDVIKPSDPPEGNIRIITIGLGDDVNTAFLSNLASSEADYHFSPSASELEAIYAEIAGEFRDECAE